MSAVAASLPLAGTSVVGFEVEHPIWVYLVLPLASALIGYITKIVAIQMMFSPLEFRGLVNPWLGWQGMIPRRAAKMAGIAVDTLTKDILRPEDLFDKLDAEDLAREIEQPLHDAIAELVEEIISENQPGLWEAMPDAVRRQLIRRVQARAPEAIGRLMQEVRANVDQVFDVKHMVVSNLVRDKRLLNRMFKETAAVEFRFLARSGLLFGFYIGVIQAVAFAATGNHWLLPAFGLLNGATTDWVALQMIFRPVLPRRIGLLRWQGLFHKRREEITRSYGELIAKDVLTPSAIMESILTGPMSDRFFDLVQQEIKATIDAQTGVTRPFVVLAVGGRRYQAMKKAVADKVIEKLPAQMQHVEHYAAEVLDLSNLITERMKLLDDEQYENLLRPAVKDDEWVIVVIGAALGFAVGELQTVLITSLG